MPLKDLLKPFKTLKNISKKPMTLVFPKESLPPTENYRGRQLLDVNKCIGCGMCSRVCPNDAINMVDFMNKKCPQIHLGKCCFCALCAENCPTNALTMTNQIFIAGYDRFFAVYDPEKLSKNE
ncbi:NADH-quinone oxidoreductase subunit I [Candidatus Bathyarchaeota archaeon]|nr:NADH-quinone oxidoreductase subunit I [Candidatus Bathyarchaeota archaeon]